VKVDFMYASIFWMAECLTVLTKVIWELNGKYLNRRFEMIKR